MQTKKGWLDCPVTLYNARCHFVETDSFPIALFLILLFYCLFTCLTLNNSIYDLEPFVATFFSSLLYLHKVGRFCVIVEYSNLCIYLQEPSNILSNPKCPTMNVYFYLFVACNCMFLI